jgi:hypothetical protein
MAKSSPGKDRARLPDDTYSAAETARRRDAIVRNMIATPPQPRTTPKKRITSRVKSAPKKRKKSTDSD